MKQRIDIAVRGDSIDLHQLLKVAGVCDSGGAAKTLVADGLVRVDGKVELRKSAKIRPGQVVGIGEIRIHAVANDAPD